MTAPDQASSAGQEETPPTCYRHPNRETLISCVRCGRPACPACLRDAAVGQQCVECVHGASQGTRRPTTVFGGRPVGSAVVTWTLVGVNVLLFLVEMGKPDMLYAWGMLGAPSLTPGGAQSGVAAGQWYRLITSAFTAPGTSLTGLGLMDIAFNMWALIFVGPTLERMLGRARFLSVYLLSALGGSVFYYYLQPHGLAAGASGAIFGLFGAWFVVSRRLRLDARWIVVLIVIDLALSFYYRSTIAWQAHVGGLAVGTLVAAIYAYAPTKNRTALQLGSTVVVLAVLALAVVIKNTQLAPGLPPGF